MQEDFYAQKYRLTPCAEGMVCCSETVVGFFLKPMTSDGYHRTFKKRVIDANVASLGFPITVCSLHVFKLNILILKQKLSKHQKLTHINVWGEGQGWMIYICEGYDNLLFTAVFINTVTSVCRVENIHPTHCGSIV